MLRSIRSIVATMSLVATMVTVAAVVDPVPAGAVTTVVVTTTADVVDADPATMSLREAVDAANGDGQATEIELGTGETYQLTICGPSDDTNAGGDLDHTETAQLTIFGHGSTIVQTCPGERVLHHHEVSTSLVVDDAIITGGNVTGFATDPNGDSIGGGGGVLSHGRTILDTVTVTANSAEDIGAGVRSIKEATFTDSNVDANTGGGGGAAVGRDNDFMFTSAVITATGSTFDDNDGTGLAIYQGTGTVADSSASGNTGDGMVPDFAIVTITGTALDDNGGFGVDSIDGPLTVVDSSANGNGGDGLKSTGAGSLDLTNVTVDGNGGHGVRYIGCDGVGTTDVISLTGSTVTGNAGTGVFDDGCGGVSVHTSTVSDNDTGIACTECSTIDVQSSTVATNTVGGGIVFVPDDTYVPTASLTVRDSDVTGNVAPGDGGGIAVNADGSFDVFASVAEGSTIAGNTATDGDGGGIAVDGADLFLTGSTVTGNTAGDPTDILDGPFGRGGGVFVRNGSLSVALTMIVDNAANGDGGGIAHQAFSGDLANLFGLTVTGNDANGTGGGIDIDGADGLSLADSVLAGNQSIAQGGGLSIANTAATVERVTVEANTSGAVGGGIHAFENQNPGFGVLIDQSTVTANAGPGGAVFAATIAPTVLRNSTVSGNATVGVAAGGNTDLELRFATVVDNQGGNVSTTSGDLTATASVVADPTGGANCAVGGATVTGGSNADTDGTCGLSDPTDQPNLAGVGLGPLAANGGDTDTHAVTATSPLRDAVAAGSCTGFLIDQRGVVRPQGPACDVGAYESTLLALTSLVWETVAVLGPVEFPITDRVDLGDLTPDPTTLRLLEVPQVGEVSVRRGSVVFVNPVPDDPQAGSPLVVGEFDIVFEICAVEDPGTCGQGTIVLTLGDPADNCTITGTRRAELLVGTPGPDIICGAGGGDLILGLGGNDIVLGQGGRDLVLAGRGDDIVVGGRGNDVLVGERGTDWLDGGDGFDTCLPGGGVAVDCEFPRRR